jgi:hypothetical protein
VKKPVYQRRVGRRAIAILGGHGRQEHRLGFLRLLQDIRQPD